MKYEIYQSQLYPNLGLGVGLHWFGLFWIGMDMFGYVCLGLFRFGYPKPPGDTMAVPIKNAF